MRGTCGGVRHGPESFNYYFPQDIVSDGTFLVMWEGWLKTIDPDNRPQCYKAPFRHLSEPELRAFLLERVGRRLALTPTPTRTRTLARSPIPILTLTPTLTLTQHLTRPRLHLPAQSQVGGVRRGLV